jgi:hypothetical protein
VMLDVFSHYSCCPCFVMLVSLQRTDTPYKVSVLSGCFNASELIMRLNWPEYFISGAEAASDKLLLHLRWVLQCVHSNYIRVYIVIFLCNKFLLPTVIVSFSKLISLQFC